MTFFITLLLLICDALASVAAFLMVYIIRFGTGITVGQPPTMFITPVVILISYWWVAYAIKGLYRNMVSLARFDEIYDIFKAVALGTAIIFILTFDLEAPFQLTRVYLFGYGLLMFAFTAMFRMALREFQMWLRWRGIGMVDALIVGFNEVGRKLCGQLQSQPAWGFRIAGFIGPEKGAEYNAVKVISDIGEIAPVIKRERIGWLLFAPDSGVERDKIIQSLDLCFGLPVRFLLVVDYYQMVVGFVRGVRVHGLPLVEVVPNRIPFLLRLTKRFVDIVSGLVLILILALLILPTALLIKLDSSGSIFKREQRVGKYNKPYWLRNFRVHSSGTEPQLTRVGRILRRWHVYRLPEAWNVLTGTMSLVGPQAETPEFVSRYESRVPLYRRRFAIRPGVTGWAQIRYKYQDNINDVVEKNKYDLYYIDHLSPALDTWIVLAGLRRALKGENTR